jgi:hypothetical protein
MPSVATIAPPAGVHAVMNQIVVESGVVSVMMRAS